jgi:hypothetical protein
LLGYEEETRNGRRRSTGKPHDYQVVYLGNGVPTVSVKRPYAYLIPEKHKKVLANLLAHGIEVRQLTQDTEALAEKAGVQKLQREERPFQKHSLASVEAAWQSAKCTSPQGTYIVRTGQTLGDLVVYLLEPESEDGLCTWNFFDEELAVGKDYPVLRLTQPIELKSRLVK